MFCEMRMQTAEERFSFFLGHMYSFCESSASGSDDDDTY